MDQGQPTNAQIMAVLSEQQARADEQQRRVARLEAENIELRAMAQRVEAENSALKTNAQRLDAELERQRMERLSLTSRVNEVEGGPAAQDKKLSRAGLFKAAAMGSAAVVGAGALGTLGAEHAAAATTDTNFVANGTSVTNFDARGAASTGFDTNFGSFYTGGAFVGSGLGADVFGATTSSIGLRAQGGQYGAELGCSPTGVPLHLLPAGSAGPPTTGTHFVGEIYVDSIGRIHHCAAGGNPGTWVPLNALVPIAPVRVLDTRSATRVGASTGPFGSGVTLTFAISGQTFATSSGSFTFPSNVVGVVGNLVAVTPTGAGYLVAYPRGVTIPTAASVNFVPPGTGADVYYSIGNHVTVALNSAGQMSVYMGLVAGANVQVVLDIAGYLL